MAVVKAGHDTLAGEVAHAGWSCRRSRCLRRGANEDDAIAPDSHASASGCFLLTVQILAWKTTRSAASGGGFSWAKRAEDENKDAMANRKYRIFEHHLAPWDTGWGIRNCSFVVAGT